MKTAIQIVLAIVIVVLGYLIFESIMEPVRFKQETQRREAMVVQRLKDIRTVQLAHRSRYGRFLGDLDSLVNFAKYDSLPIILAIGNVPDTLTEAEAVRLGIVKRDTAWVMAKDTLLTRSRFAIDSMPFIPFSGGQRFTMASSVIERGLVQLPVFEAFALPRLFMSDLQDWKVYYTRDLQAGLRVGSLIEASTDGNWE